MGVKSYYPLLYFQRMQNFDKDEERGQLQQMHLKIIWIITFAFFSLWISSLIFLFK